MANTVKTLNGYDIDAVKLNGKPASYYLPVRNLLVNGYFANPVNQRGQTSYTPTAYTIDRWEVLNGTFVVHSGYISTGFVQQKMLIGTLTGVHTLAAKRRDGTILVCSQEITSSYSYTEESPAFGAWGDGLVRMTLPAGEYVWAALYEGEYTAETLPPYVPKGYMAELAECQRYYYYIDNSLVAGNGFVGTDGYTAHITIQTPSKMRVPPSITGTATVYGIDGTFTVSEYTIRNYGTGGVRVSAATPAKWTVGCPCVLYANGGLALSADL